MFFSLQAVRAEATLTPILIDALLPPAALSKMGQKVDSIHKFPADILAAQAKRSERWKTHLPPFLENAKIQLRSAMKTAGYG